LSRRRNGTTVAAYLLKIQNYNMNSLLRHYQAGGSLNERDESMKSRIPDLKRAIICALLIFAATVCFAADDRIGLDQWTKALGTKASPNVNLPGFSAAMDQGNAWREKKKYPEALAAFSEAIRLNPRSSEAYRSRGTVQLSSGDMALAWADCRKAVELDPNNAKAYNLRGNLRRGQKDFSGAMADYRAAIKLDAGYTVAMISLANVRTDMGQYDDALADLNRILASDPGNLDALVSRGYVRKQIKDYAGAKEDFQKVLKLSPQHVFAARSLKSIEAIGPGGSPSQAPDQPSPASAPAGAMPSGAAPASGPAVAGAVLPPVVSKGDGERPSTPPPQSAAPALANDGTFKEADPCKPDLSITDVVWSAIETAPEKSSPPAINDSRFRDLLVFSATRHNHPVTTAKAQLAYLMGDLSPRDQAKFDEKWSPFFRYPSDAATDYFQKLIPLLSDLIEKRNQLTSAVMAGNEAQKDADQARVSENAEALADALVIAERQAGIVAVLEAELKALAADLQALGDPPNPLAQACKAMKKHDDGKTLVKETLKAAISPKKLQGEINIAYAFKPEITGIAEKTTLHWDFGDGEETSALPGEVKHTFKKGGRFVITVSILNSDRTEKVALATSRAFIAGPDTKVAEAAEAGERKKIELLYKDSFSTPALPPGCRIKWNQGQQANDAVYESERLKYPEKYPYYYLFTFRMECPNTTVLEKGALNIPFHKTPAPFTVDTYYPGDGSLCIDFTLRYMPDHAQSELNKHLDNILQNKEQAKDWKPFKFPGWEANGYIRENLRGGFSFWGLGENRTTLIINHNSPMVQFRNEAPLEQCMSGGRYCNKEESKIADDYDRDERAKRVKKYSDDLKKKALEFAAAMKLKGLPSHYNAVKSPLKMTSEDEAWLNGEPEILTPDEFKQRQERLAEAEKFYKSNIELLQKNLAREEQEYGNTSGKGMNEAERKAALFFRMMAIRADIQAEQDKINTLHTGRVVHTRTQYDDYVQNKFVERIKEEQEKYVKLQRAAAIIRKEANKLPPEERATAAALIDKRLNGKTLAKLDEQTVKQVGEAIFNKTQGYNEAEAAKYEEESHMWDDYATRAEKVKFWADIGMIGCSFLGGPMALSSVYDISTGYLQGGPKEAATQLLFQAGAFALGKYMGAGHKVASGAEEAAEAAKAASGQSRTVAKGLSSAEELKIFQANRAQGEKVVREFSELNQDLKRAYLSKASRDEIALIKKQIRDKTVEIQANPHAKNFLKYNNDKLTQTRFNRSIGNVHKEVERKFYEKMRSDKYKWGDFEVKEMRNASSSGSVGMDYDIGLIEKPNFVKLPDGTMKPQYWLMKDGKPAARKLWQAEAQKCWNEAYQEVTLKNAGQSWENVTTRIHPESYQDLAVLDGNLSKVSKEWIQQTADVTRYKSLHMLKDGSMSKFEKLQEISRGTAKDLNTKLMPLLGHMEKTKQVAAAAEHWKQVSSVLDEFGKNKIDPITAERRIAELTGGKSIPEVVDDMSYMMESIVKLGKKP